MKNLSTKTIKFLKETWHHHGEKLLIILAIILTSLVSFNAGQTYEKSIKSTPISMIINEKKGEDSQKIEEIKALGEAMERKGVEMPANQNTEETPEKKNCAFVGSKNSDKYHLPDCRWAKNIKPENLVCFFDENDAKSKGYLPDKNCIK